MSKKSPNTKVTFTAHKPMRFVKIRADYYAVNHIVAVKKLSRPRESSDGTVKSYIVHISSEAAGDPQFNQIWLTSEEAQGLLELMEMEGVL